MCKKKKTNEKNEDFNKEVEKDETNQQSELSKSYYYDDAHGYKTYTPEDDEEDQD